MAELGEAYQLLTPLLGAGSPRRVRAGAAAVRAERTVTGDIRGPGGDGGLPAFRLPPVLRRLVTRLIAIIPAVIVTWFYGDLAAPRNC